MYLQLIDFDIRFSLFSSKNKQHLVPLFMSYIFYILIGVVNFYSPDT